MKNLLLVFTVLLLFVSCNKSESVLVAAKIKTNKECPVKVDDITTLEKVDYEPGDFTFIFNYLINEEKCSMEDIDANLEAIAENVKASMELPPSKDMVKACKKAHVSIVYTYRGSETKTPLSIVYNPNSNKVDLHHISK